MRSLAKAPMPTALPSISTVVVPSGETAVTVPAVPGDDGGVLEELEQAGRELELLGDAAHHEAGADVERRQRDGGGLVVVGARDRVAVRAGGGRAEQAVDGRLDVVGDDVLPLAGLLVGVGPRQPEDVGEEALGQAVAADLRSARRRPSAVRLILVPRRCSTRPSASSLRIISDTAGRDTSSRSAMRAWMTAMSSSASSQIASQYSSKAGCHSGVW